MELDKKYKEFLEENVLKPMKFEEVTRENIDDVYDYIVDNFEIPYTQGEDERLSFILELLRYFQPLMDWSND